MCHGHHSQLWRRGSYCIGAEWGWGIGWGEACSTGAWLTQACQSSAVTLQPCLLSPTAISSRMIDRIFSGAVTRYVWGGEGCGGAAGGSLGVGGTAHGLHHMTKVVTSMGLGVATGL